MVDHSRVEPLVGGKRVGVGDDIVPKPTGDEQHRARLELTVDPRETRVRAWMDIEPFVPAARGSIGALRKRVSVEEPNPFAPEDDPEDVVICIEMQISRHR